MAHPSFTKAALAGAAVVAEIEATAAHLEQLMRDIHGGHWRIDIDHTAGFVLVVRHGDLPCRPASEPIVADVAAAATSRGAMLLARVERQVSAVAVTMEAIHGGQWRMKVDHETLFVLVSQRLNHAMNPAGRAV